MRYRGCKPVSVWSAVEQLYAALAAMDPERDWGWLRRLINRLHAAAPRSADVRIRLIPPQDLLARAIEAIMRLPNQRCVSRPTRTPIWLIE
jgi:hypothetical protein